MRKPPVLPLTSIRIFLILYIAIAHFLQVATKNEVLLKLFKQHNMVVGAFFALSGYILAYVYSEFHSSVVRPMQPLKFAIARLTRIYPPYFFVLLIFSPMFIYIDLHYGNGFNTIWHALTVLTLTQAWFPSLGLLWNSPTWFLSAYLFPVLLFPFFFPSICRLKRKNLFQMLLIVGSVSILLKMAYSNICGWSIMEGIHFPETHAIFNFVRFNPLINSLEFLMGVATARVMMTSPEKERRAMPGLFLALMIALIVLRVYIPINDMIVRSVAFLPLFLLFIVHLHRSNGLLARILSLPFLVYLGEISFSFYIIHGAIGQFFYKKAIASLFFSAPVNIFVYFAITFAAAIALYHFVEAPAGKAIKKLTTKKTALTNS